MNTVEYVRKELGDIAFVREPSGERPPLALRTNKRILVVLDREVIGPFVNRSTDPSDTIRFRDSAGRDFVRVPSRKFKSKEKLRGLEICRSYGLMDSAYEYNAVSKQEMLNNPNSVLFGDTQTEGDVAGIPSKIVYGEGLSTAEVSMISQPLTHNALSEEGTMWDRHEGKHRTSLFETTSILPGAHIVQTVTIDSPTPEALIHLLMCLSATRYGAQTGVTGPNIKNHVMAIVATTDEPPVTAYTIVNRMFSEATPVDLATAVKMELEGCSGLVKGSDEAEKLVRTVRKAEDLEQVYKSLAQQSSEFYKYVFGKKEKKPRKSKEKSG